MNPTSPPQPSFDEELKHLYMEAYLNGVDHEKNMESWIKKCDNLYDNRFKACVPEKRHGIDIENKTLMPLESVGFNSAIDTINANWQKEK
jgi:hypothetical protein